MANLEHAKIYRGGITAQYINLETTSCSYRIDQREKSIAFSFNIASKGGGTTRVVLHVGKDDWAELFKQIGSAFPDQAPALAEASAAAYRKTMKDLAQARKMSDETAKAAEELIADLEPVAEFVNEKYMALPAGEDEREEELNNKIDSVIRKLQDIE